MSSKTPGKGEEAGLAKHGPRTEVNWEGGSGRQPYENRTSPGGNAARAEEFLAGNRGEQSGANIEELEEAKRRP